MLVFTNRKIIFKKNFRLPKKYKGSRSKGLENCPQKKGICFKVLTMKPKKPNSEVRKIAKVTLSTRRNVTCYIPGSGHELREYSRVLVRGGHVPDLPGVQYRLIRGKCDFSWEEKFIRKNRRSKYGIPRDRTQKFYR